MFVIHQCGEPLAVSDFLLRVTLKLWGAHHMEALKISKRVDGRPDNTLALEDIYSSLIVFKISLRCL